MTEAEGDALLKKGDKKCLPSLMSMRLRPDWEAAAPLYERAAAAYKAAGCGSKAKVAYEKAAHANDRLDSPWHAGKFIEKAAQLASEPKDAHSLARQASDYYIKAGKIREAADALGRGAKLLEDTAPEIAGSLYKEAIGIHRNEQRAAQASDLVSQAVALQVEQQQHRQAAELLSQFAQDCLEANAVNSAHKAYLGAVVVQVYAGDMEAAWASYQDALEVHSFATSDEAHAGEALFAAYSSGDEAAVRQLPKGQAALRFLDASVARLARQLPQGDFAVQAQTAGQLLKMGTVHTLGAEAGEEEEEEEDLR